RALEICNTFYPGDRITITEDMAANSNEDPRPAWVDELLREQRDLRAELRVIGDRQLTFGDDLHRIRDEVRETAQRINARIDKLEEGAESSSATVADHSQAIDDIRSTLDHFVDSCEIRFSRIPVDVESSIDSVERIIKAMGCTSALPHLLHVRDLPVMRRGAQRRDDPSGPGERWAGQVNCGSLFFTYRQGHRPYVKEDSCECCFSGYFWSGRAAEDLRQCDAPAVCV
ncbi:unnamed protein product, partial [Trichogramma brassicae]